MSDSLERAAEAYAEFEKTKPRTTGEIFAYKSMEDFKAGAHYRDQEVSELRSVLANIVNCPIHSLSSCGCQREARAALEGK